MQKTPANAQFISVKVKLIGEITKEERGMYSSYCPALDVFSQGATKTEAKNNLIEVVQLMIEVHLEEGTFAKWLKKQGFRTVPQKLTAKNRRRKKATPPSPNTSIVNIPAEFPVAAYC